MSSSPPAQSQASKSTSSSSPLRAEVQCGEESNKLKSETAGKNEAAPDTDASSGIDCQTEAAPSTSTSISGQPTLATTKEGIPLSKNQMKKRKRYEKAMEVKRRRKQQEKDAKIARALAAGRNLEEERRVQLEREKSGKGHQRREEMWLKKMKKAENSFRVCIDCSFGDEMTPKEIGSLSQQIRYCYAANKRTKNPCYLSISSLSGLTFENLKKVCGFPDQWLSRAFSYSEKSLLEMHPEKSKLVYLTSDSENTLDHLDDSKIYVIGGIVDRNRLKGATIARAETLGIETARLPITTYLKLFTTKVLTCNHVFELLLKYREHGNDWKKAMLDVLPKRKDVKEAEDGDTVGVGAEEKEKNGDTVGVGAEEKEKNCA